MTPERTRIVAKTAAILAVFALAACAAKQPIPAECPPNAIEGEGLDGGIGGTGNAPPQC